MTTNIAPFPAPIAHQIWDKKYRFKHRDGTPIDLTVRDTWSRIAKALAAAEDEDIRAVIEAEFYAVLEGFDYLPAGRIVAGAGTDRTVTLSNCFTMGTIPDSMDGIFSHLREAALTMQQGGGIGYDFSTIRPKGADVLGVAADASGPLTFMDVWDAMCRTVMSAGSRRGAMMATMRCDHPDIEDFVTAKHDPLRLRMFNLSVLVTDEFMEAVKANDKWDLVFKDKIGNEHIFETISARELWDKIMKSNYDSAEPGVIFIDRVNRDHNLSYIETVATTNPCGEKPMGPYASCLLGSINLVKMIVDAFTDASRLDRQRLYKTVTTAIRMMDNVVDVGGFPLPEQLAKAKADRQLGLGITGLADALAMLGITYGSKEAADTTELIMRDITIAAYQASVNLAKEKGAFPNFDADQFTKGENFAARMLPGDLVTQIRKHGIRNSLLVSIAPTGTISLYAGNLSSGIEPIFAFGYDRKILNDDGTKRTETVEDYAVAEYRKFWEDNLRTCTVCDGGPGNDGPCLCGEHSYLAFDNSLLPECFVSAQTITPEDHIRMQAAAQKWVDSSISKTTNVPVDCNFEDFKAIYMLAWDSGCKGCTTYRPNEITGSILSVEEPKKEVQIPSVEEAVGRAKTFLTLKDDKEKQARKDWVRKWLENVGVSKVTEIPSDKRVQFIEAMETYLHPLLYTDFSEIEARVLSTLEQKPEIHKAMIEPQPRPEELDGTTYKLKFGDLAHAIYVTITDIEDDQGNLRPFELFLNTKAVDHTAWMVTVARLVSAIFRRPHDSRFIVQELKDVFDPNGGAYLKGSYVPSISAAIGGIIERHMVKIGYSESTAFKTAMTKTPDWSQPRYEAKGSAVMAQTSVPRWPSGEEMSNAVKAVTNPIFTAMTAGKPCPKCSGFDFKHESGCATCLSCGWSKCG